MRSDGTESITVQTDNQPSSLPSMSKRAGRFTLDRLSPKPHQYRPPLADLRGEALNMLAAYCFRKISLILWLAPAWSTPSQIDLAPAVRQA